MKVLIVEDDQTCRMLAKRVISKSRFKCELDMAHDGEQAFNALFSETDSLPDLVLLDLKLPGIDGFDVLARIRQNEKTKNLPVLIWSTSAEEEDIARGYGLSANGYLQKPVQYEAFEKDLLTALEFWLGLNKRPARPKAPG